MFLVNLEFVNFAYFHMIHPLHIKYCENFILGSLVGFQEILHQKLIQWELTCACYRDIMYCMWESKSKLNLFLPVTSLSTYIVTFIWS